jgi:hypothetical protein
MFVVGTSCTRQETRAFASERTWAYQTKSAFSDMGCIALWRSIRNGHGCRGGQRLFAVERPQDRWVFAQPRGIFSVRIEGELDLDTEAVRKFGRDRWKRLRPLDGLDRLSIEQCLA